MILTLRYSNTITAMTIKTGLGALLIATQLSTLPVLAEETGEWPLGHYRLPEHGDLIGEAYTVVVGNEADTLLDIARTHNLGYEEIRRANPDVSIWVPGVGTEVLVPAQHILPDADRTGIVINIAELRLYYYPEVGEGEVPRVETYPIGIGRDGYDTPLGITTTTMRLEDPAWYPPRSMREEAAARGESAPAVVPPGPDNPLGKHAILLDIPGYLIHGTNDPDGIGMRASRGCIRMFPEDIKAIFGAVPLGTQVNIVDQPIKVGWDDGTAFVQVYQFLEDQNHGIQSLLETQPMLNQYVVDQSVSYSQLQELLERSDGQVVPIDTPTQDELVEEQEQPLILFHEVGL
ncbi:L,D-transpeptidase family protein [Halomonas sp. 7T]|uniref:L,D-transpeptidase family protein n=1 Tax=Halomonas sp. 7T TaxID=2893469 RepID=UPI0021D9E293|nr:L,D-transpeptidase family protein [Halomonas sp. 7T]UXZ53106.1 L,D-transpeptidase family protein [Halomonas sp. 7T]